jgi:hypothetical protein
MQLDHVVRCEVNNERRRRADNVAFGLHSCAPVVRARDIMMLDLIIPDNAPVAVMGALAMRHRSDVLRDDFQSCGVQHRGVHLKFIKQISEFLSYGYKLHKNI